MMYILRKEISGYYLYDNISNTIFYAEPTCDNPYSHKNYIALSHSSLTMPNDYFETHFGRLIDNSSIDIKFSAPETVFIEVTKKCNLRCGHCFNSSGIPDYSELNLSEIKKLIDELYDIGIFTVKITGGEPFCRKDIIDILGYLDLKGINYIVFSNGTNITHDQIQKIKSLKHLLKLRISIDGLESTNDSIRGKGSFAKALQTIKELINNNISCEINYTITKSNYLELGKLAQYLEREHIECKINIGMVKIAGRAKDTLQEYYFNEENIEEAIHQIKKQLSNTTCIKPFYILEPIYYKVFGDSFGCPAARLTTTVKCNGDVYPCGLLSEFKEYLCGNVTIDKFLTIWNSVQMNTIRNLPALTSCLECNYYKKTCTGACRGNAINYHKNICGPDINCFVYQVNFNE